MTDITTKKDKGPTKAELAAEVARLKAALAAQQTIATPTISSAAPNNITFTVPSTDVTIVYCSDSLGYASISNMDLHFNRYGEQFVLSRPQFDELVGKYRSWFDRGILAVSYKNIEIAAAKGLRTDKEYSLSPDVLNSLGKLSPAQIEGLWNETNIQAHRESIVSYFKRKFIEGDPDFTDRAKIDLLNRLTKGGFSREQDELSGRFKISPTEM